MDAFSVMYSVAFVLPIILITGLCIRCRRKIPFHIPETGYYEDKSSCTQPPSSFMIINKPPNSTRILSSQSTMCHQDVLLTIPRSPGNESRRSSVGREIKSYSDCCDTIPHSPSAPILPSQSQDDDYDDEGADENYTNDNLTSGYIEVLPDEGTTIPTPVLIVQWEEDNRASFSSVGTDEPYVNVGDPDDIKGSTADGNYVNVGNASDTTGGSLEYVNVQETETESSSIIQEREEFMPDYENVEL